MRAVLLSLFVSTLLVLLSCKSEPENPAAATAQTAAAAESLTREAAVAILTDAERRISSGRYDGIETLFAIPSGFGVEDLHDEIARLSRRKEISAAGIQVLSQQGSWGLAADVFGAEKANRHARKFGVDPAHCYGLRHDPGEAIFCRMQDGVFRLVRLDDVGKLSAE